MRGLFFLSGGREPLTLTLSPAYRGERTRREVLKASTVRADDRFMRLSDEIFENLLCSLGSG